ncbi:MAG: GvpL/GvpF family gas vesicle protein [Gemmatimonadetes bacterium]|nr:GvpL/GvpF family gas vesicle protein [Gemmatimonadota bacterium]
MNDVVYLYGFVPSDAPPPADVAGVGDAPVRLLKLGPVQAAVADLPAGVYGADAVEARLEDLDWVGEQGLAHERVVTWFADNAEILPARLFSLYSGEQALRDAVGARMDEVTTGLRALSGRREWNLKVAYDADELARHGSDVSPELKRLDDEIAAASPGRRYLLERRRGDLVKQEVTRAGRTLAHELLEGLRPHAADVRILPLAESEEQGTVTLNAALLVDRDAETALRTHAAELYARYTELGMIVSFSGPWAPYRFVDVYGDT